LGATDGLDAAILAAGRVRTAIFLTSANHHIELSRLEQRGTDADNEEIANIGNVSF
jgi:hypothetical protein